MKKVINVEIITSIIKVLFVILLCIISYLGWSKNTFSSLAVEETRPLEINVIKDTDAILDNETTLNKENIIIKNPNNSNTEFNLIMYVNKEADISNIHVIFNGKKIDTTNVIQDKYYLINLGKLDLKALEINEYDTAVYGDPYTSNIVDYRYEIKMV